MKFTCDQSVLASALGTVARAVSNRTPVPITQGIKVVAEPGMVTLTATNLEITMERSLMANVSEPGETVVMGNLFLDIVKKLPELPVNVTLNGDKVAVECFGSKFTLVAFNAGDFPVAEDDTTNPVRLNRDTFTSMIKQTIFATSTDEAKGVLQGILVDAGNHAMTFVAIDGFRMALRKEPIETGESFRALIPAQTMSEISRINNDSEDMLIALGEKTATFTMGDTKIHTRLYPVEDYVAWENLVPANGNIRVLADTDALEQGLDRAAIFADGANGLVKMEIDSSNGILLTSRSEVGNVREVVDAQVSGGELTIGFNVKYVLDALKTIKDEDSVLIRMSEARKPAVIVPTEGDKFLYMVLPVIIPG